jgi:hypothetical protein
MLVAWVPDMELFFLERLGEELRKRSRLELLTMNTAFEYRMLRLYLAGSNDWGLMFDCCRLFTVGNHRSYAVKCPSGHSH